MDRSKAGLKKYAEIVSDLKFDIEPKYMAVPLLKLNPFLDQLCREPSYL